MRIRQPVKFSVLLLCIGTLLATPPLVLIFNKPLLVAGIPLSMFYIFGFWAALIVGAIVLSRALPRNN